MRNLVLFVSLLLPLSVAAAQFDCANISTSQQVDICAKQAKESADSNLNVSYQKLIKELHHNTELTLHFAMTTCKAEESQRAW